MSEFGGGGKFPRKSISVLFDLTLIIVFCFGLFAEMPNGAMPVLEVDGKMLPETQAIQGYLAREFSEYFILHSIYPHPSQECSIIYKNK